MNTIAGSLPNIRAYLADQGDADLTVDSSVTASLVSGLRCRRVTDGDVAYATLEIAVEICAPSVSANLLGEVVDYAKPTLRSGCRWNTRCRPP